MTPSLPTGTPAEHDIDARGVLAFLDAVEAAPRIEPHGLTVLRHGHVVAAGAWSPYRPDLPHMLYSLSKSFTSTALGLAVAEGLVRLDDRVVDFFPEYRDLATDDGTRAMRVRHLASMSSGHTRETWDEARRATPDDPVRGFLALPPDRAPGTVFAYNQPCTYTLGVILQRVTGTTLAGYLRPRLFDPLGIGTASWQRDELGRDLGFIGLFTTTDAIARLGELYLRRGVWQGRRILSEDWVAEATRPQVTTAQDTNSDWQQGYGFQFWMSRHGYRADGAYGQFGLVLPEQDAVIAYTGATVEMQAVLELVWRHLLPALGAPGSADADAALADRLAALALPPVPAGDGTPAPTSRTLSPAGAPSHLGLDVRVGNGTTVVLRDGDTALRLPLVPGRWSVADGPVPAAASGGWTDGTHLAFDVLFLEAPHRLAVTADLAAGTFDTRWTAPPMTGPALRLLGAPH
ncbi:MAG TPA: serine hydrolase [Actinocatenispora sp.]